MKEFKFKDRAGFEEIDVPVQLDDFEAKGSKVLKTRYIFDFSAAPGYPIAVDDVDGIFFRNFVINGDTWDLYNGAPGHAELLVNNVLPTASLSSHISLTQKDISGERDVPYWNENAMLYLDSRMPGAYGDKNKANIIKSFRSGYVEISFKTDKQDCILGMGTVKLTSYSAGLGTGPSVATVGNKTFTGGNVVIDNDDAYLTDDYTNVDTLYLKLSNGKLLLEYSNDFGNTKKSFSVLGTKNLADDKWHHVVINFNKPGILEGHAKKTNKKFIEFWVDGKLDKKDDQYINDNQVFFPMIEWLMMDPLLARTVEGEGWETFDLTTSSQVFLGENEIYSNILTKRAFNDIALSSAFRGSINHFISGFNFPLNKFEIQQRYRLFNFFEKPAVKLFKANAKMVNPSVAVNKKRALKLFWNNLINEKSTHGLELDESFIVDSYSVTHRAVNSVTEINNIDLASEKPLLFLKDVKAVFKDAVNLFGPTRQNFYSRPEIWNAQVGEQYQLNMANYPFDALNSVDLTMDETINSRLSDYSTKNMPLSGISLQKNDRILLTNQYNKKDNGIYIFNGYGDTLTRAEDALSPHQLKNAVVRVTDGYYKDTSWLLSSNISSLSDNQEWVELEYHPSNENINSQPVFSSKWSNENGTERFIDLEQDIDISKYDVISFMNYPETNQDIYDICVNLQLSEIKANYEKFIKTLQNVVVNGASLYVSSPKLAEDIGVVKKFTVVDQSLESFDAQSSAISPFEVNEPKEKYFDTHRNNQYRVVSQINGLTNKETYILTDFINYNPDNNYDYEQYHAKYSYRQFGLQIGNEFIIPGLSLRKITNNSNLPGFTQNQKRTFGLLAVAPEDIITGTIVTALASTYYSNSTATANPYSNYATTIIVHNNQILNGQAVTGKIFINCVEDGYTFSRIDYNKAVIQVIPSDDTNESVATRAWQYSTSRLNREPSRINISQLTEYGQTTPTNGGGGPLIQAPTNSSNGIIRSKNDRGNNDYESDLYPKEAEERYTTQEIPTLSMTWLGLGWLSE